MQKSLLCMILFSCFSITLNGQISSAKFGKGIQILGHDSTFYTKMNVRFQNLMVHSWKLENDEFGSFEEYSSNYLVRRSRLKFGGWAFNPKIKYKLELGLSNRDIGNGTGSEFNKGANVILDAYVDWNFYKGFWIRFGQGKLPGNRERVISSSNLQFVDRSRLNSRYNIDRDVGLMLTHKAKLGSEFILIQKLALSQGEGRNVTIGNSGARRGSEYTYRLEALPFGKFKSKGDYVGSAVKREEKPKLSVGLTYDINTKAMRNRGNLGSFIATESTPGQTLSTFFADLMFKYQGFSTMIEYVKKSTDADSPVLIDLETEEVLGTYYTGSAINVQAGYMFENNYEIAARVTSTRPDIEVDNDELRYTLGISKFVVGHNLKVQTDFTYRSITSQVEASDIIDDQFIWRTQFEIQF